MCVFESIECSSEANIERIVANSEKRLKKNYDNVVIKKQLLCNCMRLNSAKARTVGFLNIDIQYGQNSYSTKCYLTRCIAVKSDLLLFRVPVAESYAVFFPMS